MVITKEFENCEFIKKNENILCSRCNEVLKHNRIIWLELIEATDDFYKKGILTGKKSQGWFPFGSACAEIKIKEREERESKEIAEYLKIYEKLQQTSPVIKDKGLGKGVTYPFVKSQDPFIVVHKCSNCNTIYEDKDNLTGGICNKCEVTGER